MVFITVFVMFVSYLFTMRFNSPRLVQFVLFFMFIFCFYVFTVDRVFYLYLFYEASLLPILYIIVKWGSYPERSLRGLILLLYTSVFTFPFLYIMFMFFSNNYSFSISFYTLLAPQLADPYLFTLIIFLTFAVKLPIYGLHF